MRILSFATMILKSQFDFSTLKTLAMIIFFRFASSFQIVMIFTDSKFCMFETQMHYIEVVKISLKVPDIATYVHK